MKKIENSPFDPLVKRTFPKLVPYVPERLSPNMISWIGLAGAAVCFLALSLSGQSRWMVLIAAVGVFVHWFADTLDGEVARARGATSRLGYFLDIFLDSLAVVLIGLGVFLIPGSHLLIGALVVVVYLLLIIAELIKAELTRVTELPAFGPTEIHLTIVLVLIGHAIFDFGRPLGWWPGLIGDEGWLTGVLGMTRGLCLIDLAGLVICAGGVVMLLTEIRRTASVLNGLDRADHQ